MASLLALAAVLPGCPLAPSQRWVRRGDDLGVVVLDGRSTSLGASVGVLRHRSVVISYMDAVRQDSHRPHGSHIDVYGSNPMGVRIDFGPDTAEWIVDTSTGSPTFLADIHALMIDGFSGASGTANVVLKTVGSTGAPLYSGTISYTGYDPTLTTCTVDVQYTSTPFLSSLDIEYHGALLSIPVGI